MRPSPVKPDKKNIPIVRITVVGVGGGGGNAISRMSDDFVRGVEFVAVNTDAQDLEHCSAKTRIHIGESLTKGMGTGMNPDIGRQAAEENRAQIAEVLKGSDLVFLTAGMGGGTGTGATPVIAEISREVGALTVAIVTKPFLFEGSQRMRIAEEGILRLKDRVDALITIPNDRIFNIIGADTPVMKAFLRIDDVLKNTVRGISEIIASAGLVNVDFADVKAIMQGAGLALTGVGQASGKDRALKAASQAVNSPLLEFSIEGAQGVLFGISGGHDITMSEINDAAKFITETVDPSAKIIFGTYFDRKIKAGQFKVTLIATGFHGSATSSASLPVASLFPVVSSAEPALPGSAEGTRNIVIPSKLTPSGNLLQRSELIHPPAPSDHEDEDRGEGADDARSGDIWDIPAFLRRRKR